MPAHPVIWTVGHSDHPLARFLELLQAERIEFLVDVRSYPYSRHAPQFNRETLGPTLERAEIRYVFRVSGWGAVLPDLSTTTPTVTRYMAPWPAKPDSRRRSSGWCEARLRNESPLFVARGIRSIATDGSS